MNWIATALVALSIAAGCIEGPTAYAADDSPNTRTRVLKENQCS